ncbi:alcohol acetyltransferase, partial [Listeria monocytogenes]
VHQLAKKHGTTITAFISSLLIAAIYKERLKFRAYQEEIKIAIPVNLRNFFPSTTLRNFFGVVHVCIAVNDNTTLDEIILEVSKQLR